MPANSQSDKAIAPNHRKIVVPWRDESITYLINNLREMFKSADQVLLEFADKAQNNKIQTHFFEAMRELWLKQDSVISNFQDGLERTVFRFRDKAQKSNNVVDTLSLVDKDSFEKNLALQTIANQSEKKNYSTLYELTQRLAIVNDGHKVSMEDIPASPKQLAEVFDKCSEVIFIEKEVRLVLYTLFDRFVISKAAKIYEDLNQRLIDADILPDLKPQFINKDASTERQTKKEDSIPAAFGTPDHGIIVEEEEQPEQESVDYDYKDNASSSEIAEEAFSRIKDLLASQRAERMAAQKQRRRSSDKGEAGSPEATTSVTLATSNEVSTAISSASVIEEAPLPDTGVRQEAVKRVEVDAQLILNINQTLKKQRELIKKLVGKDRIQGEDEDVIDIVGMIFELMLNDENLHNVVKTLLSHLHTPYLKIAVEDPTFLTDHEHPARRLFELMITTGTEWVDPEDLTKGVYPQLQLTVNTIIGNKHYNDDLFTQLAKELTDANALLSDKQKITEDRTVEVEKGRAKLNQAKQVAQEATDKLLQDKIIIPDAELFLHGPWIDYLTLVLLRSDFNEDAESWTQALGLGSKLVHFSLSTEDPNGAMPSQTALDDLSSELNDIVGSLIPHYQMEIDSFLAALADTNKRSSYAVVEQVVLDEPQLDEAMENRIKEQVTKLRDVAPGTWFSLFPDGTETRVRVKMSWYNPITANFLFVNQAGVKTAVKNIRQLAREILEGKAEIYEKHGGGFIDRSFQAIRSLLEKANG